MTRASASLERACGRVDAGVREVVVATRPPAPAVRCKSISWEFALGRAETSSAYGSLWISIRPKLWSPPPPRRRLVVEQIPVKAHDRAQPGKVPGGGGGAPRAAPPGWRTVIRPAEFRLPERFSVAEKNHSEISTGLSASGGIPSKK